ncbi:MAG: hypothetical protein KF901_06425 [Myxococcales bacterium]|nr:hypothetical protein [Myxococcales bacterium]
MIRVPALGRPSSRSLPRRRASLAEQTDAALVDVLVDWMLALRAPGAEGWQTLADAAGLPLGEVVASPFGLRAVALGVREGATSVRRETRAVLAWSARFGDAAVADPTHGTWTLGRLRVGKYQSFQTDAPHATYDPAHIAKWGPHELMHRAAGFFFRTDATRFEHYVGARLNELLPVVLWYGHDQLARLDEESFVRADASREAPVEDARWLVESEAKLRRRARRTLPALRAGLAHLEVELDAIDRELATGRRHVTVHETGGARLDAASDALAYVVGHVARLRDPIVSALLETVPRSLGRFDDLVAYRAHIESVHDALLFAPLALDDDAIATLQSRRTLWDWLHRAALAGLDVRPLLDAAAKALDDPDGVDEGAWIARLEGKLASGRANRRDARPPLEPVLADGAGGLALGQLREGLESVAPRTASFLDDEALQSFATSAPFVRRAPLAERLADFLALAEAPTALHELLALERCIAEARPSDEARHLAESPPARGADGVVLANDAFTLFEATHDVVALHAGGEATPGAHAWLIGLADDEHVSILPCGPEERAFFDAARARALRLAGAKVEPAWLREALAATALVWRPR